jgi:hypothetical protein
VNIQTLQSLRHVHVRLLYKLPYFQHVSLLLRCGQQWQLTMVNKLHLFSPTQHKFILIQIVTFTCVLHVSACT